MSLTVTFDGTTLAEGLSAEAGDWSGTDGISTEVFQQGVSSEGWIVAKNGNETGIYDYYTANGNVAADMSATDTHLYIHLRCDIAPFIDYLYVGISSTSAGTTNYEDWRLVDNTVATEWYGEWKTFIIDINSTPNRTNGTLTYTDIRSIRINVDNSNSGNIRSIENTYIDVIRFGFGIKAHETTTAAFDFSDIEAIANNTTNKFGVLEKIGGVLFARGRIEVGDNTTTDYGNLTSQDETLVFLDASTSGEAISTGLYQLNFVGNATNPTAIVMGIKVGTGDTATGRNGTGVQGENTNVACKIASTADVNDLSLYGSTFRALGGLVDFETADLNDEILGSTFDGDDQVNTGGAVVRNCSFLNTVAASTSGALLWDEGEVDAKFCLFVNNVVGVEMVTLTGDPAFVGMEFSSNTNDVRYEGATDWALNWSEAPSAPSIINAGAGTLTAVATVTLTVDDVVPGSSVWIEAGAAGPETEGDVLLDLPAIPSSFGYLAIDTDEYLKTVEDIDAGSTSGDFEIIAYMYMTDWTPGFSESILTQGFGISSADSAFAFQVTSAGALTLYVSSGSGSAQMTGSALSITDATWSWVRVAWDASTGVATFYKSAVSAATHPTEVVWVSVGSDTGSSIPVQSLASPFLAGVRETTVIGQYLNGRVAYVSMWTDGTTATGDHVFETDLRTGPDFDGSDLRKLEWGSGDIEMFGTSPTYSVAPTTLISVSGSYAFSSTQPVLGRIRQSSQSPKYLPYDFTGDIVADTGITHVAAQSKDTISP